MTTEQYCYKLYLQVNSIHLTLLEEGLQETGPVGVAGGFSRLRITFTSVTDSCRKIKTCMYLVFDGHELIVVVMY